MSDLYISSGFDQASMPPFGPIGIITHTANKDFVKKVSNILFEKRTARVEKHSNPYINSPGYCRSDYLIESVFKRYDNGEGTFSLLESARGHDMYIITDVLSHSYSYELVDRFP